MGHPAASIPAGLDSQGTPFGLQVVGPRNGDRRVLEIRLALESHFVQSSELSADSLAKAGKYGKPSTSPVQAVADADIICTDTWVSMGMEGERDRRLHAFSGYQVNRELVVRAPSHALIMHCLPAHPGEEISSDVLRSARSIVLDQTENRQYTQMTLLRYLVG
ncbi:hypothetical protein GRB70_32935 [Bradyrhizobium neotropicale]|nr:hypothetical protein [Bradyrhizobium neotropicale]